MKRRNKLKLNNKAIAVLAIFLAVGFAYISSAVNIGGVFTLFKSTWDIHFDNVQVTEGSVSATTPSFDSQHPQLDLSVSLTNPGDYYEFTIDAVNNGDIDGMLDTFSDLGLTEEQLAYLKYTVTYADGEELAKYQELNAGDTCTFKIRIEFRDDIPASDLPAGGASLSLGFDVSYVRADSNRIRRRAENTLYNVLKTEAESGGLAKKYTGEHQDSIDASKSTKDVYYFYGSNTENKNKINEMNNIIFGNQCWKMYRTTDTGGVKLIYNGESEEGQCQDNRGTHDGYSTKTTISLSDSYWYGTSYNYDKMNKKFSIDGTKEQKNWNNTTSDYLIGRYTCMSTNINDTCSVLYYIIAKKDDSSALAITINSNISYKNIGGTSYDYDGIQLESIGYMHNNKYKTKMATMTYSREMIYESTNSNTAIWYADTYSYNSETNKYILVNPFKISSTNQYADIIGKYTLRSSTETITSEKVYYIANATNKNIYLIEMRDNNDLNYYNYNYTFGDSYTDNGDGSYTINSPNTINRINYYNNYQDIKNKYLCKNAINNTCSDIRLINYSVISQYSYKKIDNYYKYSNTVSYENGKYILNNESSTNFDTNMNTKHYTCWNISGECNSVSYIYYGRDNDYYYINLNNGKDIEDAIQEMFYADDVNTINSLLKQLVDEWYKRNLINYSKYLDNTIYCNKRKIVQKSGLNRDSTIYSNIVFNYTTEEVITCDRLTNSFSHDNDKAYLEYSIGILSYPEYILLRNSMNNNTEFLFTLTPKDFGYHTDEYVNIYQLMTGTVSYSPQDGGGAIKPSISLKSTAFYTSGNGSMETPYVIYTE